MPQTYYRKATLDHFARQTLNLYDPQLLLGEPTATPIDRIIEFDYGIRIEYVYLRANGNELGKMIYDDGFAGIFNPETQEYEITSVSSGTMLIDEQLLPPASPGRLRFTQAHELAHWILHKDFFTDSYIAAAAYKFDNNIKSGMEWQANYFASELLMPSVQVKKAYYNSNTTQPGKIFSLANIFNVSYQAMSICLNATAL
ncbi:MAG: ImmA/IrrE family metallo-endopeptidase [Oscillospiraceae bacterium]|nr:ImmA/IrrE family metallo-endopeptidase [Oscillospiraceae bacterium]